MFTGIIQEIGTVINITRRGETAAIRISAPRISGEAQSGDSICVNGVCLTVTELLTDQFQTDLSSETLQRSTFASIRIGDFVNLELSLRLQDRIGGHWVMGHVDGVGILERLDEPQDFSQLGVRFPAALEPYIAEKGSISIDGISLTIAAVRENYVEMAIIPYTLKQTTLHRKRPGDGVNIEVDILARYVERWLQYRPGNTGDGLTEEKLREFGYF